MSTDTSGAGAGAGADTVRGRALPGVGALGDVDRARALALGGAALLIGASYSNFYHFIDVTADPTLFLLLTAVTLVLATAMSRAVRPRVALLLGAALFAAGLAAYVVSLPKQPPLLPLVTDAISLMTGRSLLQITNVDVWVLGVAPAPVFLTWYFALRRWYVTATAVGGATLLFVVLTGDATTTIALVGVVGAVTAVGAGDIERRGADLRMAEPMAVLLSAMILFTAVFTVVPNGSGTAAAAGSGFQTGGGGGGGANTVEASLIDTGDQISVKGSIELSPKIRFTVESTEQAYWRVGAYDRYTGDGWVRTGGDRQYRGRLRGPVGNSRTVVQTVTTETRLGVVPAAWKPVRVSDGLADRTTVTDQGGLVASQSIPAGETFQVRSRVPVASPEGLRTAGTDYPDSVAERYTKVPSSTPDRVEQRTSRITARADNPYDTARVIERWLERNKQYSLEVDRPDGNVADKFLFEMDAGYCTYFATTMVTMLRTQGIPARFVVGYTPGERVAQDEWVVRGYNAHAWVEVYFPDVGWVRFDPTPGGPRQQAETSRLEQARENNESNVDTDETLGPEWTPTPTPTPAPLTTVPDNGTVSGPEVQTPGGPEDAARLSPGIERPDTVGNGSTAGDTGGPLSDFEMPSREQLLLGLVVLVGFAVGARRSGLTDRAYRTVWLRYQPTEDPDTDAERAYRRLSFLLAERHRPRRPGETVRQYLRHVRADERAREVAEIRERARYGDGVSREEADRAIELVDELVGE